MCPYAKIDLGMFVRSFVSGVNFLKLFSLQVVLVKKAGVFIPRIV
jgi:hypothetical protein